MHIQHLISKWSGPISGLLFLFIYFVGIGIGSPFQGNIETSLDEPAPITATVCTRSRDDVHLGVSIASVGIFFFWFCGYLLHRLRDDEGERGWMTTVALAGGIATLVMPLVALELDVAASRISEYANDRQVARALAVLAWTANKLTGASTAALIGATSFIVVSSRDRKSMPVRPGWIGLRITLVVLYPQPSLR